VEGGRAGLAAASSVDGSSLGDFVDGGVRTVGDKGFGV
jgi:hypothetical protein